MTDHGPLTTPGSSLFLFSFRRSVVRLVAQALRVPVHTAPCAEQQPTTSTSRTSCGSASAWAMCRRVSSAFASQRGTRAYTLIRPGRCRYEQEGAIAMTVVTFLSHNLPKGWTFVVVPPRLGWISPTDVVRWRNDRPES